MVAFAGNYGHTDEHFTICSAEQIPDKMREIQRRARKRRYSGNLYIGSRWESAPLPEKAKISYVVDRSFTIDYRSILVFDGKRSIGVFHPATKTPDSFVAYGYHWKLASADEKVRDELFSFSTDLLVDRWIRVESLSP